METFFFWVIGFLVVVLIHGAYRAGQDVVREIPWEHPPIQILKVERGQIKTCRAECEVASTPPVPPFDWARRVLSDQLMETLPIKYTRKQSDDGRTFVYQGTIDVVE